MILFGHFHSQKTKTLSTRKHFVIKYWQLGYWVENIFFSPQNGNLTEHVGRNFNDFVKPQTGTKKVKSQANYTATQHHFYQIRYVGNRKAKQQTRNQGQSPQLPALCSYHQVTVERWEQGPLHQQTATQQNQTDWAPAESHRLAGGRAPSPAST